MPKTPAIHGYLKPVIFHLQCMEKKGFCLSLFLAVSFSSCSSTVLAFWHLIYQTGSRLSIKTLWSETTHCVPDTVTARMEGDKILLQSCHYLGLKDIKMLFDVTEVSCCFTVNTFNKSLVSPTWNFNDIKCDIYLCIQAHCHAPHYAPLNLPKLIFKSKPKNRTD